MTKRNVISYKNLPPKSPVMALLVLYFIFEKLNFPEWAFGALGFFALLCLASWGYGLATKKQIEIEIIEKKKS